LKIIGKNITKSTNFQWIQTSRQVRVSKQNRGCLSPHKKKDKNFLFK